MKGHKLYDSLVEGLFGFTKVFREAKKGWETLYQTKFYSSCVFNQFGNLLSAGKVETLELSAKRFLTRILW